MAASPKPLLMSLQTQCLTRIIHHLDDYSTEYLCLLPTRQRKELLMSLPPLDICKLEATDVVKDVDINQVWQVVCKLYGETDNVRVTGNHRFDKRYLNYNEKPGDYKFFDHSEKVRGDWRTHFLTRTTQILLHSSDPAFLPINIQHSELCECSMPSIPEQPPECDCWGDGVDPTHQVFLQRLMAVPPQSNIAKCFSELSQRAAHFKDVQDTESKRRLLVPLRYAEYFADGFKIRALDLLSMLLGDCQFQPKLLPIHCEFMYYSELFQLYLSGSDQAHHNAHGLFVEFLAKVEQVEFYWMGGLKGTDEEGRRVYPSIPIPKIVLEAILVNPAPKLDTLGMRVYSPYLPFLDSCLEDVAPFFSALHAKNSKIEFLPISTPYSGLKKLHLFGNISDKNGADVISSIILHQSAVEGLEIMCTSKTVGPNYLLDPIVSIFSQPQFQYLAFKRWLDCDMKEIFHQFIDSNCKYEIHAVAYGHEVVIPAWSKDVASPQKKHLCFQSPLTDQSYLGILFVWLQEANLNVPLLSVTVKLPLSRKMEQYLVPNLSTCHALTVNYKRSVSLPDGYLNALSGNTNLKTLKLHNCSFAIDKMCQVLQSLYAKCAGLKELSFQNNKLNGLSAEKLKSFFETLLSYSKPEQLSLDLRYNNLKDGDVDLLIKVWREMSTLRRLHSLTLDSEHHQDKVEELVLEY